jgi:hypothetical protein
VAQLATRLRRELTHCLKLVPAGSPDARTQGQREALQHVRAWLNVTTKL